MEIDKRPGINLWATVGKALTALSVLLGVIAGITALHDRSASSPNLEVTLSARDYLPLPKTDEQQRLELQPATTGGSSPIDDLRRLEKMIRESSSVTYNGLLVFKVLNA